MNSLQSNSFLGNISVVLIEPHQGGNIGSVARAMKNMGLSHLVLVRPHQLLTTECKMMAGKALDLVEGAKICPSLDEAVADSHLVVGTTSARGRRENHSTLTPREAAGSVAATASAQKVALVFGPERSGLTDGELACCRHVVSIPSHSEHPVLNLAQAVMILAYEIFTAERAQHLPVPGIRVASQREREQMFAQMAEVLMATGFLSSGHPEHIMNSIRRLLLRCDLTSQEVRIIRGAMSQILWYQEEGHLLPPEKVTKP